MMVSREKCEETRVKLTSNHLGLNPDLHSEKPASNCLSYGMASLIIFKDLTPFIKRVSTGLYKFQEGGNYGAYNFLHIILLPPVLSFLLFIPFASLSPSLSPMLLSDNFNLPLQSSVISPFLPPPPSQYDTSLLLTLQCLYTVCFSMSFPPFCCVLFPFLLSLHSASIFPYPMNGL